MAPRPLRRVPAIVARDRARWADVVAKRGIAAE